MEVRHPAELRLRIKTGYDIGSEQAAQMTSSVALRYEPECPNGVPPRLHQIIGYLCALTFASDGSRCGAPYEIDLRTIDGVGDSYAAESKLLLDENTVTVRRSENLSTLSRKHFTSSATMPVQLPHDKVIVPTLYICFIPYFSTLKLVLTCL